MADLETAPHPPAVQEERQRGKEKEGDNELGASANEEMPVEKILDAELAVEQKSDQSVDGSASGGSSVSRGKGRVRRGEEVSCGDWERVLGGEEGCSSVLGTWGEHGGDPSSTSL